MPPDKYSEGWDSLFVFILLLCFLQAEDSLKNEQTEMTSDLKGMVPLGYMRHSSLQDPTLFLFSELEKYSL